MAREDELLEELLSFHSKYTITDKAILDVDAFLKGHLEESRALSFNEGIFESLMLLSAHHIILNEEETAYDFLESARQMIELDQVPKQKATALANIYIMYYADLLGNNEKALEYCKWGLKYADEKDYAFDLMNLRGNYASFCIDTGLYEEGLAYFDQLNPILISQGYDQYLSFHYEAMARGHVGLEEWDQAYSLFEQGYDNALSYNNLQMQLVCTTGIARILAKRTQETEAIGILEDRLDKIDVKKSGLDYVEAALLLAVLLYDHHKYCPAAAALDLCAPHVERSLNHSLRYRYYTCLSQICQQAGKYDKAVIYSEIAHRSQLTLLKAQNTWAIQASLKNQRLF